MNFFRFVFVGLFRIWEWRWNQRDGGWKQMPFFFWMSNQTNSIKQTPRGCHPCTKECNHKRWQQMRIEPAITPNLR